MNVLIEYLIMESARLALGSSWPGTRLNTEKGEKGGPEQESAPKWDHFSRSCLGIELGDELGYRPV